MGQPGQAECSASPSRSSIGPSLNQAPEGVLIAIPLYRSPELLPDLAAALLEMAAEIRAMNGAVLFIDDSPDDEELSRELDVVVRTLRAEFEVDRVVNANNLGFVRSANRAMELAFASDRDLILLNSDTLPRPGAFRTMVEAAYSDPMIGFVSPRSDNATICNSPTTDRWRGAARHESYQAHLVLQSHLPAISYVPTAVGFCLLIKRLMIAEFGFFDTCYGAGYNEENDFIRRSNQFGYRAALANHAYVHHIGGVSFSRAEGTREARDIANHRLLVQRYPEYETIVRRHFDSANYHAERVLTGLLPVDGRLRVLFDCRVLGQFYNGTFEHLRRLLAAFANRYGERYDIAVLCDEEAFAFHDLGAISHIRHSDLARAMAEPAAIAFKMSQPTPEEAGTLTQLGAVIGAFVLDTIALDCQQLDESDFLNVWQEMADDLDLIGFNSTFSRDQFQRRFVIPPHAVEVVSSCSTDTADYQPAPDSRRGGAGILLIGNHFPHKFVRESIRALGAAGSKTPIVVLGLEVDDPSVVASYAAGHIPAPVVENLYAEADLVLFPSHYEGFGLPIMHALARHIPVIARDLPCAREIRDHSPHGSNLHLFASTDEMVALALDPPVWTNVTTSAAPINWDAAATELADAFKTALSRFDFDISRRRQGRAIRRRRLNELEGAAQTLMSATTLMPSIEKGIAFAHSEMARLRGTLQAAEQRCVEAERRCEAIGAYKVHADALVSVFLEARGTVPSVAAETVSRIAAIRTPRYNVASPVQSPRQGLLRLDGGGASLPFLRERLVAWGGALAAGEALQLRLPRLAGEVGGVTRVATALLLVAGCAVRDIRVGRRAVIATGIKMAASVPLAEAYDNGFFLEVAYRLLHERLPDDAARAHHIAILDAGTSRAAVRDSIAASSERWERLLASVVADVV